MPPVLETERLVLRPYIETDIVAAYELFERDPLVYRYDPGYARAFEDRAALIRRAMETNEEKGEGTLAVTLRESGEMIGHVGLQLYILPWLPFATPEVELHYKFGSAYWGNGYALEAARALVDFAFNSMRLMRLATITHCDNERSIRLLERLGFALGPAPAAWSPHLVGLLTNPAVGKPRSS